MLLGFSGRPIPWMIEVAMALSPALGHWADVAVIGVLLVMNVAVGVLPRSISAANAIAALRQRLAATARVLRDGAWRPLPVRELVPGDVVRVRLGDVAPADARAASAMPAVQVDQSALTGESLPVSQRDR